jgi:hypothetical protein
MAALRPRVNKPPPLRLCLYPLLLKELCAATPPDTEEYHQLAAVLERINDAVLGVNENRRQSDLKSQVKARCLAVF